METNEYSSSTQHLLNTAFSFKVSGPFFETSCVFQYIKNIINAEMWA